MKSDDEISYISMQIILNAGDCRSKIEEANNLFLQDKYEEGEQKLKEAEQFITKAHRCQTKLLQREASGEKIEYSILFNHAQDTLSVVMSELNIEKKIFLVLKKLSNK